MVAAKKPELHNFFLVLTPGFERLALYELVRFLKNVNLETEMEPHTGGLEVVLPLDMGLSLNQYLRIPTRVLLRLGTQKDLLLYQDFQKWVSTLKLSKFFPFKQVYVSTRSSKLKMKEKLKKVFLNTYPFKPDPKGSDLYIRFFRDECTVSLDTSGEDLFMRGNEKWVGEAPIRDTMAAALLQLVCQGIDDFPQWQLVDPMMGSGTFLLEGLQYNQKIERFFAFQNWFKQPVVSVDQEMPFQNILGADLNPKNVEMAKKNLQNFKNAKIELLVEDLFKSKKHPSDLKRVAVVNPPYGKRLKINSASFYSDLVNKIVESYQPERIGIIVPRGKVFSKPAQYEQVRYLEFSNNSIDVHFHVLTRYSTKRYGVPSTD